MSHPPSEFDIKNGEGYFIAVIYSGRLLRGGRKFWYFTRAAPTFAEQTLRIIRFFLQSGSVPLIVFNFPYASEVERKVAIIQLFDSLMKSISESGLIAFIVFNTRAHDDG